MRADRYRAALGGGRADGGGASAARAGRCRRSRSPAAAGAHRARRGAALAVLGVAGRADVVEFHGTPPQPVPVEYKRGKPKPHRADEVQLRPQAICLEEMCERDVPRGALFYGEIAGD